MERDLGACCDSKAQWVLLPVSALVRGPAEGFVFGEESEELLLTAAGGGLDRVTGGAPTFGAEASPPGRWPASWWTFFSRSSLGNSNETTSPAARPSWISA